MHLEYTLQGRSHKSISTNTRYKSWKDYGIKGEAKLDTSHMVITKLQKKLQQLEETYAKEKALIEQALAERSKVPAKLELEEFFESEEGEHFLTLLSAVFNEQRQNNPYIDVLKLRMYEDASGCLYTEDIDGMRRCYLFDLPS